MAKCGPQKLDEQAFEYLVGSISYTYNELCSIKLSEILQAISANPPLLVGTYIWLLPLSLLAAKDNQSFQLLLEHPMYMSECFVWETHSCVNKISIHYWITLYHFISILKRTTLDMSFLSRNTNTIWETKLTLVFVLKLYVKILPQFLR